MLMFLTALHEPEHEREDCALDKPLGHDIPGPSCVERESEAINLYERQGQGIVPERPAEMPLAHLSDGNPTGEDIQIAAQLEDSQGERG